MSAWKRCCAWRCASWPAGEPTGSREVLAVEVAWPPTRRGCGEDDGPGRRDGGERRRGAGRGTGWSTRRRRRATRSSKRSGCGPRTLAEFVGQSELVEHLGIVLQAARQRRQPVDHILFAGPPGLGKTSLAGIVAAEMSAGFRITAGPVLTRAGDLAALLTDLQDGDVLFIDEIHRLHRSVEEMLYSAMEDGRLDILIGKGPTARSIRLELPKFTLVGATTRTGLVSGPLRDRFGFVGRLDLYDPSDLRAIVERSARILKVRDRPGGGDPDLGAVPGHASGGQSAVAPGPRLRRGPRRGLHRRRHRQRGARALRRRRAGARQGRPINPHHAVRPLRGTTGWASPPWRSAWGRSPTRSRMPTSPSCSRAG